MNGDKTKTVTKLKISRKFIVLGKTQVVTNNLLQKKYTYSISDNTKTIIIKNIFLFIYKKLNKKNNVTQLKNRGRG